MESRVHAHPAIAAGLAGGIGLILPAVAYAASSSVEGVHEVVQAGGVPFAVGAVAGAGLCAISFSAIEVAGRRADRRAEQRAEEDRQFEAYATQTVNESVLGADETGFFQSKHAHAPKGVPVIARAADALSEEEAWAEIDSLLDDDSPISCDAEHSKDIYQIALEELARTQAASEAYAATGARPDASEPAATAAAAEPYTTSAFLMAAGRVAGAAGVTSAIDSSELEAAVTFNMAAAPQQATAHLDEADADRRAALSSLDTVDMLLDLDEPSMPVASVAPVAMAAEAVPAEGEREDVAEQVQVADYSGHEDMWAAALAILAEDDAPRVEAAEAVQVEDQPAEATETFSDTGDLLVASAPRVRVAGHAEVSAERAEAIAEGERATEMHGRVNEILGEELSKVHSKGLRRTSREYLSVIQGGTVSMRPLTAEA